MHHTVRVSCSRQLFASTAVGSDPRPTTHTRGKRFLHPPSKRMRSTSHQSQPLCVKRIAPTLALLCCCGCCCLAYRDLESLCFHPLYIHNPTLICCDERGRRCPRLEHDAVASRMARPRRRHACCRRWRRSWRCSSSCQGPPRAPLLVAATASAFAPFRTGSGAFRRVYVVAASPCGRAPEGSPMEGWAAVAVMASISSRLRHRRWRAGRR